MIKKFLGNTVWVSLGNFSLTLVGLINNIFLTKYFKISDITDSLIIAKNITEIILKFILIGNISIIIAPLFIERFSLNKVNGMRFIYSIHNFFLLIFTGIIFLIIYYKEIIINFIAPGFTSSSKILASNILILYLIGNLFTLSISILNTIFNARKLFFNSSIVLLVSSIIQIILLFFLIKKFKIYSFPISFIISQFFGMLSIIILLVKDGNFNYKLLFIIKKEPILSTVKIILPFLITVFFTEINSLFYNRITSTLSEGDLTSINLAYKLFQAFNSVLIFAVSTVLVYDISQEIMDSKTELINAKISKSLYCVIFILITLTVFFCTFSQDIVKIIFERGSFNQFNTLKVGNILIIFFIGIIPQFIQAFFYKLILMLRKTAFVSVSWSAINIFQTILFFPLSKIYGIYGIALAQTFSVIVASIIFSIYLYKNNLFNLKVFFNIDYLKIFIVSLIIVVILALIKNFFLLNYNVSGFFILIYFIASFIIFYVSLLNIITKTEAIIIIKNQINTLFSSIKSK